jgi:hypothetical protein
MTERKGPVDHALDLFLYAPLGLVMNIEEVLPQLIERGHQQVTMARMFGQFAVQSGTQEAKKRLEGLASQGRSPAPPAQPSTPNPARAVEVVDEPPPSEPEVVEVVVVPAASELAITDYDSLSASQVVPRLDGLSAGERDAVRRYEGAHRGRKTILAKLHQLA